MNFKPDDYYFGGDGYYTILHVFGYPTKGLENFWMLDLMQISGTRAFLSIYRENNNELKEKLKSSIDEKVLELAVMHGQSIIKLKLKKFLIWRNCTAKLKITT